MSEEMKIQDLTQRLSELEEQERGFAAKAKELAEKRDKLNEQFKSLRAEIFGLRSERDRLNEEVKELKKQRDAAKTEIREKMDEIKKINHEINVLSQKMPSKSLQILQKEFESLEWKIQTTPLSLKEERKVIEQVKQLGTQINIHKKFEQLNQKVVELKAELKALQTKSKMFHEKLTEKAQESQKIHEKLLEKIEESKKIKVEADGFHKLFLQEKEKVKPVQEEISKISNKIKMLKEETRRKEAEEKKKRDESLREKLEKQAKDKLKRGEKLTWEEFQLLTEKDMEAQD
ncbi:MAG: coiled-coil protein [Candidatus Bathycorpusculaceae bacterium]